MVNSSDLPLWYQKVNNTELQVDVENEQMFDRIDE